MKRKHMFFIAYFVGMGGFVSYGLLTHKDTAISRLQSWSANTTYRVVLRYPETMPVPQQGKLGAFYSCMQGYAGVSKRKITTPITDINEQLEIELEDFTKFEFGINSIEASTFIFKLHSSKREYLDSSNLYAINCDIRLLDKPDSDMHCEDRLLGNHVRPVCTYRPQVIQQTLASTAKA